MPSAPSRLAYIDWLRGLACVLMFQTHCYDAWLGGAARNSKFAMWSQLGGTFPAPLFLFLAGVSFALVVDKLLAKGLTANQIAKTTIRRGAEVLGLGLLFRIQEFAISLGWAPWSDLFRIDILNTIGISIILMGLLSWAVTRSSRSCSPGRLGSAGADASARSNTLITKIVAAALLACAAISALAPLLWTTWRPRFLPWELESYINGVHNLGQPQPWLFPIFPWTAFAFAGLAFGLLLLSDFAAKLGARFLALTGAGGFALIYLARFLDSRKLQIYPVFDFWHTSPEFFMIRLGLLLLLTVVGYAWCRWGPGQWGFSPLIQLGKTSLLVYWVHIEFVYGRFSILPRHSQSILGASRGLLIIFLSMLALSALRLMMKASPRSSPFRIRSMQPPSPAPADTLSFCQDPKALQASAATTKDGK
jgi:uncharacterized membrane protein